VGAGPYQGGGGGDEGVRGHDHLAAFGVDEAGQDTSYDEMVRIQRQINDVLHKNPWIESYGSGTGGFGGQNQGFMFAAFKNDKHRPKANAIIGQLEEQFMKIPGVMVFLQVPPLITLGQNEGRSQYSVALQDADVHALYKWAPILEAKLQSIPQLMHVNSDLRLSSPRLDVQIDRNRALALGVTPDAIANTLYDAYGNRRVTTITAASNQYDVLLEVLPQDQRDPSALRNLYIRSNQGKMVPLSAVSTTVAVLRLDATARHSTASLPNSPADTSADFTRFAVRWVPGPIPFSYAHPTLPPLRHV